MLDSSLERKLRELVESAAPEVVAIYLYGSRARGSEHSGSDLDLGVLLLQPPPATLKGVARDLEAAVEAAVRVPAQVVVLNQAPVDLVHRVLRDGILVLDRDRAARLRFEVQARNEYFDMAPIRQLYRRVKT